MPDADLTPLMIAFENTVEFAETKWEIPPGDTSLKDVQNSVNESPVVLGDAAMPPLATGQQMFDAGIGAVGDIVPAVHVMAILG